MHIKLPDLPNIGERVSFKTWRPYTPKNIGLTSIAGISLGLTGVYLSLNNGGVESILASACAGALMFKLWLDNRRSAIHNKMLSNIVGTTHTKFGVEFSSPLDSFSIMPEYFLSRTDIREWLWDSISSYKYKSYINKDGLLQHQLIWDLPSTDQQILVGTMLSIIDVTLAKGAYLCMSSIEGNRNTQLDANGIPVKYVIDLVEMTTTEENDVLHTAFNQTLGFVLNVKDREANIAKISGNINNEANTKSFVITGHGKWSIAGGLQLEINQAQDKVGFDVTLVMENHQRGQTLYHKDMQSINSTWGHLVI